MASKQINKKTNDRVKIVSENFAVILPSYKEIKNISISIKRIRKLYPFSKIIIVDDSPPQVNAELKKSIREVKNLELISRLEKKGRGSAVIDGLKLGLKDKRIDYFFEMDSDLAQDPKEIKHLIEKKEKENLDLVVGSRYIPGGKIVGIPISRIILSRLINKFLQILLGVKVTDYTDGFRLYTRKAVEVISKEKFESTGFITLTEILFKLNRKGIKIGEVPATIYTRKYGTSTRNLEELIVSLVFVLKLKVKFLGK